MSDMSNGGFAGTQPASEQDLGPSGLTPTQPAAPVAQTQPAAPPQAAPQPTAPQSQAPVQTRPQPSAQPQAQPPERPDPQAEAVSDNARQPIGIVLEIAGSSSHIALDLQRLQECSGDSDPSIALAGQVGSQIKIRVGKQWLLASVRTQKQDSRTAGGVLAAIDFLGCS